MVRSSLLAPSAKTRPLAQQDHAIDFRKDVGKMMRHHQDAGAGLRQFSQNVAQFQSRAKVQTIARFIQQQRQRIVHQGAADQQSVRFAGRHLGHLAIGQMRHLQKLQHLVGLFDHRGGDFVIRLNPDAAEESRQHHFAAGDLSRAAPHQFVRNDSQQRAQLEDVPGFAAQNGERRIGLAPADSTRA